MNKKNTIKTSFLLLTSFFVFTFTPCWAMSTEQEVQIGRTASLQLEKKYKVLKEPEYHDRLERIGTYIVKTGLPRQDLTYHFNVIDENSINALAFPGGFIYATRGLMDNCSDGEIAFVMAHEIAHVTHYHMFKQIDKSLTTQLGLLAIALILTKGNINVGTQNTLGLVHDIINSGYSRTDEREADISALYYMAQAGIDPKYAILVFEKFKESGSGMPGFLNTFIGSHPLPEERINYAKAKISEIGFTPKENSPILSVDQSALFIKDIPVENEQVKINTFSLEYQPPGLNQVERYEEYKKINYPWELGEGKYLKVAEQFFYEFLKANLSTGLKYSKDLDAIARNFSGHTVQNTVFNDFILFVDMLDKNTDYRQFIEKFKKEDLPELENFDYLINSVGISIVEFKGGQKQIIAVFNISRQLQL